MSKDYYGTNLVRYFCCEVFVTLIKYLWYLSSIVGITCTNVVSKDYCTNFVS